MRLVYGKSEAIVQCGWLRHPNGNGRDDKWKMMMEGKSISNHIACSTIIIEINDSPEDGIVWWKQDEHRTQEKTMGE